MFNSGILNSKIKFNNLQESDSTAEKCHYYYPVQNNIFIFPTDT